MEREAFSLDARLQMKLLQTSLRSSESKENPNDIILHFFSSVHVAFSPFSIHFPSQKLQSKRQNSIYDHPFVSMNDSHPVHQYFVLQLPTVCFHDFSVGTVEFILSCSCVDFVKSFTTEGQIHFFHLKQFKYPDHRSKKSKLQDSKPLVQDKKFFWQIHFQKIG